MPLERIQNMGEARAWRGEIPIASQYTAGIAGERFLRTLKDKGLLLAARCPEDQIVYLPASLYCERCFRQLNDLIELEPRGTVETYTTLYVDLDGRRLDKPQYLAFIRITGSEGGLIHRLGGIASTQVKIGMEVEAVLLPAADRKGSILDIRHFRPA